jgi:hypothetical protein
MLPCKNVRVSVTVEIPHHQAMRLLPTPMINQTVRAREIAEIIRLLSIQSRALT